jgi:FtsZ-binding cell division protein ZapB
MPSEEDKKKAAQLKQEVQALRAKRNDPATPRTERARLKLKIETRIWQGQRLDPEQFKTYRWRSI